MIRIILPLLAVLLVAAFVAYVMRPGRKEFHDKMLAQHAKGYAKELKGSGSNHKLEGMSETELVYLLVAGSQAIEQETNRKNAILGAGVVAIFFLGMILASQDGMQGLIFVAGPAAAAGYGINQYWSRKIREPLLAMGLDPDRLKPVTQ